MPGVESASQQPGDRRWPLRALVAAGAVLSVSLLAGLSLWLTTPGTAEFAEAPPPETAFIELRRNQAEAKGEAFELRWRWVPLESISPYLRSAVVWAEDPNFWEHSGVDWWAIALAAKSNLEHGSLSYGGSTITQQLAKNLYLSPSRTPLRKLRELFIAKRLEADLPKERIFELYLNIAEWGPGVFGADAAAEHWYGRSAGDLLPGEAVRLALFLPRPTAGNPEAISVKQARRARWILREMKRDGAVEEAAYQAARSGFTAVIEGSPPQPLHDDDHGG